MARFCMADIHGAKRALDQCLERSGFDKENDTLIQTGDVADGWNEVYECVETLLEIKNLISIKGNHDAWFLEFIRTGYHPDSWNQGGFGTLVSYTKHAGKEWFQKMRGYTTNLESRDIPSSHEEFFTNQLLYHIDEDRNCFVHGGFNRHRTMQSNEEYDSEQFFWDRDLWMSALSFKQVSRDPDSVRFKMVENFNSVFIGHTATTSWKTTEPMKAANIYNLDTGAGFNGKLTIMNIDTKEYFQSDLVQDLYPEQQGRN